MSAETTDLFGPTLPVTLTREQARDLADHNQNMSLGACLALLELAQRETDRQRWPHLTERELDDVRRVVGGPDEQYPPKRDRVELGDEEPPPTEGMIPLTPEQWETIRVLVAAGASPEQVRAEQVATLVEQGLPLTGHGPWHLDERREALDHLMAETYARGFRAARTMAAERVRDMAPPHHTGPSSR